MKRTFALLAVTAILTAGCSQNEADVADDRKADRKAPQQADNKQAADSDHAAHSEHAGHGGWWCGEHGIPEEQCSMCSTKAAAKFKQAGDWCEEHNRADSQCFICHPERKEFYAKMYRAKYGKKPPQVEE